MHSCTRGKGTKPEFAPIHLMRLFTFNKESNKNRICHSTELRYKPFKERPIIGHFQRVKAPIRFYRTEKSRFTIKFNISNLNNWAF